MTNELIQVKDWVKKMRTMWAASLGVILALIAGVLIGILAVEARIINDCKYIGNFRIGDQGYTCARRI